MVDWSSPIYAFFHPIPSIGHKKGRHFHEFRCFAKSCWKSICRYLDTTDAGSTSNIHKHAKKCWGVDTIKAAMNTGNVTEALDILSKYKDGSIAAAFRLKGKGKATYSHQQHTTTETR